MSIFNHTDPISDVKVGDHILVVTHNKDQINVDYYCGLVVDLTSAYIYLQVPGLFRILHLKPEQIIELQIEKDDEVVLI